MNPDPKPAAQDHARFVKAEAARAGFDETRITSARAPLVLSHLGPWIEDGLAGEMAYLETQRDKRSNVAAAFPWARSVIVSALQYDTPHPYSVEAPEDAPWIARYAWGDDYHEVVRARLESLRTSILSRFAGAETRVYVDTGPVAEKAYAVAAGLGAYGKNTCVLNQRLGSWFFIGVVITDVEIENDSPTADICGSCRACLDACPTAAFPAPYVLDARRCISYLTIEVKGAIDPELRPLMGRQVFGCDICQDVCPWNRKRQVQNGEALKPRPSNVSASFEDLATMTVEEFAIRFRKNPIKRAKRRGLLRNVAVALGNAGGREHLRLLDSLLQDDDPIVREHAAWGRARLLSRVEGSEGPSAPLLV